MSWRLEDVTLRYRLEDGSCVDALRSVSLSLHDGEQVAVVGPNGSGKSALALCLAGLLEPTAGRLVVQPGAHTGGLAERSWAATTLLGAAALVFQSPEDNLIAEFVEDEIALTLEHTAPVASNTRDPMTILGLFGIGHLARRRVEQLSGGEKQLLAVASAFAAGHPMIILDEPTSHLDPPSRTRLIARLFGLLHLEETGTTCPAILLVTQYEDEARRFPRVIELDQGVLVYDGPSGDWRPRRRESNAPALHMPDSGIHDADSGELCSMALSEIESADNADSRVVLRVRRLAQVPSPGWPSPPHPLSDITLTVRQGERIALCGPIGSGKSSLAFHLAGLIRPHEGTIELGGADARQSWPVVLIQFPERQLWRPTVLEDVASGPLGQGMDHARAYELAKNALEQVGLPVSRFGSRSPFALSGGQKRRVALAGLAAVPGTSVYILDEPAAALDAEGLQQLEECLGLWNRRGIASIIISHDLGWLASVTSRVWVMQEGRIIHDGSWQDRDNLSRAMQQIGFE